MKAVLLFDNVNDLLYHKWNDAFIERMKILNDHVEGKQLDHHHVSQYLAPIITSQRVMAAQFGNTYSSMKCKDNTTIVFDELLDHLNMIISEQKVDDAHRELLDCKTFIQHICGQNLNLLHSSVYQQWLSVLLDNRIKGDSIPGASGIIGETGATVTALNALKSISKEFKNQTYHLLLFVGDKLLALYSSRGTEELTPPDLIMLSTQCIAAQEYWKDSEQGDITISENFIKIPWLSQENSAIVHLCGGSSQSPCVPHSMHLAELAPGITLAALIDMDLRDVGIATSVSNQILSNLRRILLQRNLEMLPNTLDGFESAIKKTTDALKKTRSNSNLCSRLSSRMLELRKSCTTTTPLTPETTATAMHTALEAVIEQLKPDIPSLKFTNAIKDLKNVLAPYVEFLKAKAMRYLGLASSAHDPDGSMTLHKYVEEFPGLIHFLHIDRTSGRYLAPDMADCADMLTPEGIRDIASFSLSLVREGYTAATWRRGPIHVTYILWWERGSKPIAAGSTLHPAAVRALPPPGDITGTFYRQLLELAFPNDNQGVVTKELICIHLGLVPAPTAVQQARRLAHTVNEMSGENPTSAADLL